MAPITRFANNGEVVVAYEVFGDPAVGEPLLLYMGLDFQMVWWPDGLCEQLVHRGFAVVRFDNRDSGLSTHFESKQRENPFKALLGMTKPSYSTADMLDALDQSASRPGHRTTNPGSTFVSYPGMGHNLPEELWDDIVDRVAKLVGLI